MQNVLLSSRLFFCLIQIITELIVIITIPSSEFIFSKSLQDFIILSFSTCNAENIENIGFSLMTSNAERFSFFVTSKCMLLDIKARGVLDKIDLVAVHRN